MDALTKEKDVDDDLFDKLKEEWCFIPNPEDSRYKEILKLNVSNEKKIKLYEAYKKLCDEWNDFGTINLEVVNNNKIKLTSCNGQEILLNPNYTIDNLKNDQEVGWEIVFKSEEELLRMWLFINYMKSTKWDRNVKAEYAKGPFVLSWGIKFWEDIQFMGLNENGSPETVLSSMIPFFSDMAKNFPTIESNANRKFLVKYLNKLWEKDHPWT